MEINKGIEKRGHFKTMCFLMVQEGWKKHKTGDAKGEKRKQKKHF